MSKDINVMVDLETMGKGPNSAIVAIGAIVFDETKGLSDPFYARVDLQSCTSIGLQMDASTVMWWLKQNDAARKEIARDDNMSIEVALQSFTRYLYALGERGDICIWGNGATFDNVILRNAYEKAGQEVPWLYWGDRCYRTLKARNKSVALPDRGGVHHNALDDAKYQAECAIVMFKKGVL